MEFRYHRTGTTPDLAEIERAIARLDPAVLVDTDASARVVRIATVLDEFELLDCLRRAGAEVGIGALEHLPSVCCGGCGG